MPIRQNTVITDASITAASTGNSINLEELLEVTSSVSQMYNDNLWSNYLSTAERHPFRSTYTCPDGVVEYGREYDFVWFPDDTYLKTLEEPSKGEDQNTKVISEEEYYNQVNKILMRE